MAYKKRRSVTLDRARARLQGLRAMETRVNLENGFSLDSYEADIRAFEQRLQRYNEVLSETDRVRVQIGKDEAALAMRSSRLLNAVTALYGRDSEEYLMAGGKPLGGSSRKKSKPSRMDSDSNTTSSQNDDW